MNENIKTVRNCPVCHSNDGFLLYTINYPVSQDRTLPAEYRIVACKNCCMVFDDFDADVKVFTSYYEQAGKYAMQESAGSGGFSENDNERWKKVYRTLIPYLKSTDISILDIGCGKGGLLQFLWNLGYHNILGIDASPACIQYIKQHYAFPAFCTDFQKENLKTRQFDIILSTHVLEHIFDCHTYLCDIRSILKDSGFLYLEIPDASAYMTYSRAPFYYFDQEHINHFQTASLTNLMQSCGMHPLQILQFKIQATKDFSNCVLAAISQKGNNSSLLSQNDFSPILAYITNSIEREQSLKNFMLPRRGRGYLWGCGAFCERLLQTGFFSQSQISGIIDLDPQKQNRTICGLRIYSPDVLWQSNDEDIFVIITSVQYEKSIKKILESHYFKGSIFSLA